VEINVPDIGDFSDVPVIEILVSVGDEVTKEQPLVTLESDKATMDVPAPAAGKVTEILVSLNDKVSEGSPLLMLDAADNGDGAADPPDDRPSSVPGSSPSAGPRVPAAESPAEASDSPAPAKLPDADKQTQILVIGSGVGGYTAAFRAADLGLNVVLVEKHERLGGVCLNVGCIPSKALLHAARVIGETEEAAGFGIKFGEPEVDLDALRGWKDDVVGKLTGGLDGLAKQRKVEIVRGTARFTSDRVVDVDGTSIAFEHCIIAAGSRAIYLPDWPEDDRIIDSTGALELADVPERLLVVGGGIIGLEMAGVYLALGSKVTVVELTDQLIPGCDPDLVKPLHAHLDERCEAILLSTKVASAEATKKGIEVSFEGRKAPDRQTFDKVLMAVGRRRCLRSRRCG
jgi:dihydrolipoamide dehydrogenase